MSTSLLVHALTKSSAIFWANSFVPVTGTGPFVHGALSPTRQGILGAPRWAARLPASSPSYMSGSVIYRTNFGGMRADRLLSIMLLLQTHGQLPASELATVWRCRSVR